MKPFGSLFLILFFYALPCFSEDWPPDYLAFLEPLTSALENWSPSDFGKAQSESEKELLNQYKPRIFIGPKSLGPIDFYRDYLPKTVLKNKKRKVIDSNVDQTKLKQIERTYGLYLDYQGEKDFCRGLKCTHATQKIYGRVFYEKLRRHDDFIDDRPTDKDVIILKYSLIFPTSGLPVKIRWWKKMGARMAASSLEDWHELDIHGAIQIILEKETQKPLVVLLAQHNHFQPHIVGVDLPQPKDGRFSICFADRSNEPYLCPDQSKPKYYRTVGNPTHMRYIVTGKKEPLEGGRDRVYGPKAGAVELNMDLEFLRELDPLYTSWIPLGDNRKIWGLFNSFSRQGPPGINMNTWPALRNYTDMAQFWYFEEGDEKALELLEDNFTDFFSLNPGPLMKYHSQKFWDRIQNN